MDEEMRDPLVAFLYELMAEHVAPQRVAWIVRNANDGMAFRIPELHALAARFASELTPGPVEAEVVEAPEEAPEVVQAIFAGSNGMLIREPEGEDFSPAMRAWLDLFDDRVKMLPTFVEAVNFAASFGWPADEESARDVASKARELNDTRRSDG